ncbi:MAG: LVIVD repeat-containing protein [Sphingobacterium hotanense]
MRNLKTLGLFMLSTLLCLSCDKIKTEGEYLRKIPIYSTLGQQRKMNIEIQEPIELDRTGKIYSYKDFLFIMEWQKGIHIYNNANPSKPVAIGLLPVLGNMDIAVKDDVLYADNYFDLLSFDIKDPSKPKLIDRQRDRFSLSSFAVGIVSNNVNSDEVKIIVDYKDSLVTEEYIRTYYPEQREVMLHYSSSESGSGTGGSMARFTIAKDHLYLLDVKNLHLMDISNPSKPRYLKDIELFPGVETLFPYKDKLFVGSTTGMVIFDISNPSQPEKLSTYGHVRACDPVVVDDNYAYVTLRTGSTCVGSNNQLEVIDIKDPKKPQFVSVHRMTNPHGLALVGKYLYICDGWDGLKSFEADDVMKIGERRLEHLKLGQAYDIIPGPKSLIVVHSDGVEQFDYSDPKKLKQLSSINRSNLN